jgi:uncharacterized SAM-binding protein YcdF (DUF218 family)
MKPHRPYWGLLRRRECLRLTLRGWLLSLIVAFVLGAAAMAGVHPFLAVTDPVPGGALVIEGWQPDYAFAEVAEKFKQHPEGKVFVTGGPIVVGAPLSEYRTYAELGAAVLQRLGLDADAVQAVPAPMVRKDRTYAAARALREWLAEHEPGVTNLTLVSMSVHTRRSRLLFQKALGETFVVGVIAIESRDYEARRWWRSSMGVRVVIDEVIAYGYARFLFHPANEQ